MCVDYRELNKITVKDRYPIPHIEDHLDSLRSKKYYSTLDLKSGYHHLLIDESSQKYTAFVSHMGQFEYKRVPFGLCNAPSAFMRFVNTILKYLIKKGVIRIYIDDIIIATETIEEHFVVLKQVFKILVENHLQLQLTKCKFLKSKVEYLGYNINSEGISPSEKHVEYIKNYPVPKNVHDVHKFIGLASYFRKFIPNFSVIAKPLYDLVKKDKKDFRFAKEEMVSFEILREKLIAEPVLKFILLLLELNCTQMQVLLDSVVF